MLTRHNLAINSICALPIFAGRALPCCQPEPVCTIAGGRCTTAPSVQPPSPSAPAQDTPPEQHSISPFFQLSHMVEASQSGGGSSQAAADAAAVAAASRAAVWRTYEVCGTQSVAQPLRTWAEATTPASRSSALDAAFGFWCTPAGSSASLSARRPADTPPNHSRPASFGSAARRSDPLTPRYRRTAAVHRSPVPQAPPASRVVAASNDACAESWPDLWVRSSHLCSACWVTRFIIYLE